MTARPPDAPRHARRQPPAAGGWRRALALAAVALGMVVLAPEAAAAQPRPEIPPCPGNLLVNPGMEEGFGVRGALERLVPIGWNPWSVALPGTGGLNHPPRFGPLRAQGAADGRVADGLWSAQLSTEAATHTGGLWQRVAVEPDTVLQTTVWGYGWATNGERPDASEPPGTYALAVGIDPRGGEDAEDGRVRWSGTITVTDAWLPLSVSAVAETAAVTVFARGQALSILAHSTARWDAACLRATGIAGEPPWPAPRLPQPSPTHDPAAPPPTADPLAQALVATRLHDGLAEAAAALGDPGPMAVGARATLLAYATRIAATPTPFAEDEPVAPPMSAVLAERAGWVTLALAAMAAGILVGLGRGPGGGA